jgi:hypothetical protein
MGPLEHVIHTFNFIAPAWWMALFCALLARFALRRWLSASRWSVIKQTFFGGVLGTIVLAGGVWLWGADGKDGHLRRAGVGLRHRSVADVPRLATLKHPLCA